MREVRRRTSPEDVLPLLRNPIAPPRFSHGAAGSAICWKEKDGAYRFGVSGNRTLTINFNPLCDERRALSKSDELLHAPRPKNYIDSRVLAPHVVHERCMSRFAAHVVDFRERYTDLAHALYGVVIDPSKVQASVNVMELTWDVPTLRGLAFLGPRLFLEPWKQRFSRVKEAFDLSRLEYGTDGILKGIGENGVILKAYAKTENVFRFEFQLTKNAAKEFLGTRLDPANAAEFPRQLSKIAREVYGRFLETQDHALAPPKPSVGDLIEAFTRSSAQRSVFEQLVTSGIARVTSQGSYKLLSSLRAKGIVERGPSKGCWSCTPQIAESLAVLRRLLEMEAEWRT